MRIFNEELQMQDKPETVFILNKSEVEIIMEALEIASKNNKRKIKYKKILTLIEEKVCIF